MPADSTVTDLSFRVLSESGDAIDLDLSWFKQKNTGFQCSWAQDKTFKKVKPVNNKLPDIKVVQLQYDTTITIIKIVYKLGPVPP